MKQILNGKTLQSIDFEWKWTQKSIYKLYLWSISILFLLNEVKQCVVITSHANLQ